MTSKLDKFTSTGVKFWHHMDSMESYRDGTGHSVVSTHISPTGKCNLSCSYCSVDERDQSKNIPLKKIKKYVEDLKTRGLKAVILTGGGEPTVYKHFNELVQWLKHDQELQVALITNATMSHKVHPDTWQCFSWVRASINDGVEDDMDIPLDCLNGDCVIGCSYVYTDEVSLFKAKEVANRLGAEYVRVLPDCNESDLIRLTKRANIHDAIKEIGDERFFVQVKDGRPPEADVCHQSYFRPYLSEAGGGTVFPCDSLVLNNAIKHFNDKYALCKAEDILDFMDQKEEFPFNPKEYCCGCVFAGNVEMLGAWKEEGIPLPALQGLNHKDFV